MSTARREAARMQPLLDMRHFERSLAEDYMVSALEVSQVVGWCERECLARGKPFATFSEARRNHRGEPIGPELRISENAADLVKHVVAAMVAARDRRFSQVVLAQGTELEEQRP